VRCEDIQTVLFDYMARELGPARSELIREHLRKCPDCQAVAAEIQSTLNLLRRDSDRTAGIPEHLSPERRRRLTWASMHPVMHWIERHHTAVSVLATLIGIALLLLLLRRSIVWPDDTSRGIPVTIGRPTPAGDATNAAPGPDRGKMP
jgi:predicted anti-sigma-YlaC factor YlaD